MRHEPSFLKDILSACRKIEAIVASTSEDSFLRDDILPAAVLHHLTVTGEAISRLSIELRERHPEVPWRQIIAVRHRIVHAVSIWIGRSSGMRPPMTFPNSASRFSTSPQRNFRNPQPIEASGPAQEGFEPENKELWLKGSLLFSITKNLDPHRGRVSNFRGLPAAGAYSGLPTDSGTWNSLEQRHPEFRR